MTNEELARRIYNGETGLINVLYQQSKGIIYKYCVAYYNRYSERCGRCGLEIDDLAHECYFALLEAVEAYNEKQEYTFNTYLRYPILKRLNTATGFRTKVARKDPLNFCESLDSPIGDESDDIALGDMIPDESAEFEDGVAHAVAVASVFPAIRKALQEHPRYGDIVCMRYQNNMTLDEIADAMHCSRENIRQYLVKAFRILRKPIHKEIRALQEDVIGISYHLGGLNHFQNTNTSSTEWAALKLITGV